MNSVKALKVQKLYDVSESYNEVSGKLVLLH